jgi:glycosyltransferase involved in cell wall biosynthesis
VVIPVYNKQKHIKKTVESALAQKPLEVIVINDGSTDDSYKILKQFGNQIKLVNQHNQGVAHARNAGISLAKGKYVCCLDGDDRIEPGFLEVCTEALEADQNLGIAYTGLRWVNQDGETDISAWPGEFNYERQLQKSNQIPTCCVFRRELAQRIGGYRQRYAPTGAGAEDAAFWTVFGSLGYQARKVTDEALFVYNIGDGHVSGNPEYREVNYLAWYPWIKDRQHPFASIAKPKNGISHPVRQYDEPIISVVIPVGPGHEDNLIDALDSLEAQTFRQWEVIIVDDTGLNGAWLKNLSVTYPYIRSAIVYPGPKGAGHARNRGAELARGNFLFFLDADDFLNPDHSGALAEMVSMWRETDHGIYSDYIGRAIVDDINYLSPKMQSNVLYHDPTDKEAFIRHHSSEFDCVKAQSQPSGRAPDDMYIWNLISTLIPRSWHDDIGGFDETMPTWEDWDYWLRMAKAGKCFTRIPEPFLIYKYHSGSRRELAHQQTADGRQNWYDVLEYLKNKHNGLETRMCNCGGKRKSIPMTTKVVNGQKQVSMATPEDEFILAKYLHPNAGQHWVVGQATFTKPFPAANMAMIGHGQGKIKYGRHRGGDIFPVHKKDIALAPHLFKANVPDVPEKPIEEIQPPEPLVEPELQRLDLDDLLALPGVGPATANRLITLGINTPESIIQFGVKGLTGFRGLNEKKAQGIIEAVEAL